MYHIVYMSVVVGAMDHQDLKNILVQSRANNTRRQITGMLLLSGDNWMQVLEGEQEEVSMMFDIIERDPRHTNVYKLSDGPTAQRSFPDWSMGFTTTSLENFERLVGYFNPAQADFLAPSAVPPKDEVVELLKEFCLEREELL